MRLELDEDTGHMLLHEKLVKHIHSRGQNQQWLANVDNNLTIWYSSLVRKCKCVALPKGATSTPPPPPFPLVILLLDVCRCMQRMMSVEEAETGLPLDVNTFLRLGSVPAS